MGDLGVDVEETGEVIGWEAFGGTPKSVNLRRLC